jgi:hypothetical protein
LAVAWLGGVVLITIAAYANTIIFLRQPRDAEWNRRWWTHLVIGTAALAIGWAAAVVLFLPGARTEFRLFLLTILAGAIATTVPVAAGSAMLIYTFVGLIALPLLPMLLAGGSVWDYLVLVGALLFIAGVLLSARRYGESLVSSMRLGIERHRHRRQPAGTHRPGLHPGGQLRHPPLRRHRSGFDDFAQPGRPHGRHWPSPSARHPARLPVLVRVAVPRFARRCGAPDDTEYVHSADDRTERPAPVAGGRRRG